jgi:hypothetical protein
MAGRELNLMERRLRVAALLVFAGVVIEALALRWAHPTAFLAYAMIGTPFVVLGILVFLWSLVSAGGAGD